MRPVYWSRDAFDDLKHITEYLANQRGQDAYRLVDKIEASAAGLSAFAIGRKGRVSGTYEKPVADLPYLLAYALQEMPGGPERVVILRVIHGARLWSDEKWPAEGANG